MQIGRETGKTGEIRGAKKNPVRRGSCFGRRATVLVGEVPIELCLWLDRSRIRYGT